MSVDLGNKAIIIRDEITEGANTAERVGEWMVLCNDEKADSDVVVFLPEFTDLAQRCIKLADIPIILTSANFINATLDGAHKPSPNASRLLSSYLEVGAAQKITASVNSTYQLIIDTFDPQKDWIAWSSAAWLQSTSLDSKGAFYYTIRVMRKDGANLLPAEINNANLQVTLQIVEGIKPAVSYDEFRETINDITGDVGNYAYNGSRIILKNEIHKFDVSLWKTFPQEATNFLGSSIAIYNNYLFEIEEGVRVKVVNMATKEVDYIFQMEVMNNNHANNANFSNIFYDSSDEYPLLFVSRCDKIGGRECLIYRIQNINGVWTGTHINSIFTDLNPNNWGDSWTIDNKHGYIYHYITLYGDYMIKDGNKCRMTGWRLPSRDEIISGNNITLLGADSITSFDFDYCVLQGACVNNGLIYLMAHNGGDPTLHPFGIWVFDPILGRRISIVPHQRKEPEGIAIYNEKLYWHGRTSNTTTEIPVAIYEYIF